MAPWLFLLGSQSAPKGTSFRSLVREALVVCLSDAFISICIFEKYSCWVYSAGCIVLCFPPLLRKVLTRCLLPDQAAVSLFSEHSLSIVSGGSRHHLLATSVSLAAEFETTFDLKCLTSPRVLLLICFIFVQDS